MTEEELLKKANYVFSTEDGTLQDDCTICKLHELAAANIPNYECPWCGSFNFREDQNTEGLHPVGESNSVDLKNKIYMSHVLQCNKCSNRFALIPEKISWNANHDIYYTGGKDYIPINMMETTLDQDMEKIIKSSVEQFVRRVSEGEKNLSAWNLAIWVSRDIAGYVTKWLYEHGYKK